MDEQAQQINTESVLAKEKVFWQNRKCFAKILSVFPKHYCVLALKIQNNLYSHTLDTIRPCME